MTLKKAVGPMAVERRCLLQRASREDEPQEEVREKERAERACCFDEE